MRLECRRVIVIVCDGLGVGALPDAAAFGDNGCDTLGHVLAGRDVRIPHLIALGLGNLTASYTGGRCAAPTGAFGKMAERSAGKDTTTGHWELAGLITREPFPTFPGGFPPLIVEPFERAIGVGVLGNKAASGTEILKELGEEHVSTGRPILYTSADSVFQLAAHEEVIPLHELYRYCRIGYRIACEQHGVCRVIARPFVGRSALEFKRTPNRKDFAVPPHGETVLDRLVAHQIDVVAVGKIEDIFAGRGISHAIHTRDDTEGLDQTLRAIERLDRGLVFTNLVDFDTLFGHRNDAAGFARNLEAFDARLPELTGALTENDLLLITGDHGCDPTDPSTDHSREYVPLLVVGPRVAPGRNLGVRTSFADVGATLAEAFAVGPLRVGRSLLGELSS